MKRLLPIFGLFLFFCMPQAAHAGAAYVQSAKSTANHATPIPATIATVTAGNVILGCVKTNSVSESPGWSDNHSGSWSDTGNGNVTDGANLTMACKCSIAATSGSYTVSVTSSSSGNLAISEWSGATCTNDGNNSNIAGTASGGGQNANSGTITTSTDGDVVIGWIYNGAAHTVTANTGGGWTSIQTIPPSYGNMEGIVQGSHAAITPTWATTNGDTYTAIGFSVKAAGAGGGSIIRRTGGVN